MKKHTPIESVCLGLEQCASLLDEEGVRITYRLRLQIERYLFLAARILARRIYDYDLKGFAVAAFRAIDDLNEENKNNEASHLLRDIRQLKVFLTDVTSTDPYVRGESLLRLSESQTDLKKLTARKLIKIRERLEACVFLS